MSIFGFFNKEIPSSTNVNDLAPRINDLHGRILQLQKEKKVITITAETKGDLTMNKVFSFGNGGKIPGVGYVVMKRGYITGLSLSCERKSGEVIVGVSVNGRKIEGCKININEPLRENYINFRIPFLVDAGNVINLISLVNNKTTDITIASLLFEF